MRSQAPVKFVGFVPQRLAPCTVGIVVIVIIGYSIAHIWGTIKVAEQAACSYTEEHRVSVVIGASSNT